MLTRRPLARNCRPLKIWFGSDFAVAEQPAHGMGDGFALGVGLTGSRAMDDHRETVLIHAGCSANKTRPADGCIGDWPVLQHQEDRLFLVEDRRAFKIKIARQQGVATRDLWSNEQARTPQQG